MNKSLFLNQKHVMISVAFTLVACCLFFSIIVVAHGATWTTDTVVNPRYYFFMPYPGSSDQQISVGNDGTVYIVYGQRPSLYLAQKQPGDAAWKFSIIHDAAKYSSASFPALALDSEDKVHVSFGYYGEDANKQKVAVLEGQNFQIETVDNDNNSCGRGTSAITTDRFSREHFLLAISTEDSCHNVLQYVVNNGTTQDSELIELDTRGSILSKTIAVDPVFNRLHAGAIAYPVDGNEYALYHARKRRGELNLNVVDNDVSGFSSLSLSLDQKGKPHFLYSSSYPEIELHHAYRNFSGWQIENIGVKSYSSSIALDEHDRPHICYYTPEGLQYGFFDGIEWFFTAVDSVKYAGMNCSITMDTHSQVHISYYLDSYTIRYAFNDGSGWTVETVDVSRPVTGYSIAIDQQGTPHISYSNNSIEVQYGYLDGTEWRIQTVDTFSDASYANVTHLSLDHLSHPHLTYYDKETEQIRYGYDDGSGWQIKAVASGVDVYDSLSFALTPLSEPHIVYTDKTAGQLTHAWKDGNHWQTESITTPYSQEDYYHGYTLMIDEKSQLHLLHNRKETLYYSIKDHLGWHTEQVRSDVPEYSSPDLALAQHGQPSICFQGASDNNLWYGIKDTTGWHFQTINPEDGYRGWGCTLVLDSLSRPHISFFDSKPDDNYTNYLKHAFLDNGTWEVQTIRDDTYAYGILESAISSSDRLHLSYGDGWKHSLEYTTANFSTNNFPWHLFLQGVIHHRKNPR